MMNTEKMVEALRNLKELQRLQDELEAEIEAAKDAIKAELGDVETAVFGPYKVTYKTVESHKVDTVLLKKTRPDIAKLFEKVSVSRPLKVN